LNLDTKSNNLENMPPKSTVIGLVVVILLAGGAYLYTNRNNSSTTQQEAQQLPQQGLNNSLQNGTLDQQGTGSKLSQPQSVNNQPLGARVPDTTPSAKDTTKLVIEDQKVGEGPAVKKGDTVLIHYRGTLVNGTEIDSSYRRGKPYETIIGIGNVIKGWDEGIPGMKVGGKRKLTIPPDMAYGSAGAHGVVPPNATLIFEVELIEIK
jgi:FKBP-type peptidyl-prolyl cis-trans isomerase